MGHSTARVLRLPSGQFCNVNFSCDQKLFDDVRMRQALALTIGRAATVDYNDPVRAPHEGISGRRLAALRPEITTKTDPGQVRRSAV